MLNWNEFAAARPELAETGRALLYQYAVGEGYLATLRADGAPRVRPICPLLTDDGLFAFLIPSPKRADLVRDGRYALHACPRPDNEDAFSVSGRAEHREDDALRERCAAVWFAERNLTEPPPGFDTEQLFELLVDRCLATKTTGHGDYNPQHSIWRLGPTV